MADLSHLILGAAAMPYALDYGSTVRVSGRPSSIRCGESRERRNRCDLLAVLKLRIGSGCEKLGGEISIRLLRPHGAQIRIRSNQCQSRMRSKRFVRSPTLFGSVRGVLKDPLRIIGSAIETSGGDIRDRDNEFWEDEEKVLAGRPDANMPALLTKDVPGG
jgi:hypothetical protein